MTQIHADMMDSADQEQGAGRGGRHRDDVSRGAIDMIVHLAREGGRDGLTLREIRDYLDERGFGLLILILSIPCLVPALYGVPQVLGIPLLLLAGQLLIGRKEPWLPSAVLERRVPASWLKRMADFADRRLRWTESLSRARLRLFADGPAEQVAAAFMILAICAIVLPLTNTVPSTALALMAAGLIQRDGLFVLAGMGIAAGWVLFLALMLTGVMLGAGWAAGLTGLLPG